ncbi:HNH endonuclease, partial [Rhodococcus sp. 15-1189-1-1a]
ALIHGEHALECQCRRGERCPHDGAADRPDPRRGPLVQILLDAETLLGLRQNPAVLADGTPLDPELARLIATDAHWQGLLTELHDVLTARTPHTQTQGEPDKADPPGDTGTHTDTDTGTPDDTGLGDTETEDDESTDDESTDDGAAGDGAADRPGTEDPGTDGPDDSGNAGTGAAATNRRQVPRTVLSSLR